MKIWPIVLMAGLVVGWVGAKDIQFTPGEQATWERLTRRVADTTPTHRLELYDDREFYGWPLNVTTNSVRWAAPLGAGGRLVAEFSRGDVERIEALPPPPAINYCDVSFQLEFPELRMIRRPPYSLLSDEPPTCIEHYLDALAKLHAAFRTRFGALTEGLGAPDHVQVLIFSREQDFRDYQRRTVGRQPVTQGFYSPAQWRLALFDQRHMARLHETLGDIAFESEKRQVRAATDAEADRIGLYFFGQACALLRQAERANQRVLRHEGAHQLFHASGILAEGATPGWLAEGLALWCEPSEFGLADTEYVSRVKTAQEKRRLIPLVELLGRREKSGHGFFTGDRRAALAYAESWSLVRLLLRPTYQSGFFAYLRYLRDWNMTADIRRTPSLDLLGRFLKLTPAEIEARWKHSIERLPLDVDGAVRDDWFPDPTAGGGRRREYKDAP